MTRMGDPAGLVEELDAHDSFVVTSHADPDGDAVGSMLAMHQLLQALGKSSIACITPDPAPRSCRWLPGIEHIGTPGAAPPHFELMVVLDAAGFDRFESVAKLMRPGARVAVVDHHVENQPCGDYNYIDSSYAAVGEMMVELFDAAGVPLTRDAAECMYFAQITDTGGYRFSNTNPRSHRIAARLLETGLDVFEINHRAFDVISLPKVELLKRVLERRRFSLGGRVAYSELTLEDMTGADASAEDLNGLVNYMRNIEGVEVGILFRELSRVSTKISFRSRANFDSAAFLRKLGGGGHPAAAGATLDKPIDETRRLVLDHLPAILEDLK